MKRSAIVRIDLAALQHNFQRVKQLAPQSRVMAVIKADAYGHGIVQVATALSQPPHCADAFAVAHINEALRLREAGIEQAIIVLQGFQNTAQLVQMQTQNIQPVIHQHEQLTCLQQTSLRGLHVWMKVNTGMGRLGFSLAQAASVKSSLQACAAVESIILMSHFANADEAEHALNQQQVNDFKTLSGQLKLDSSLCNSAGLVQFPNAQADWVRPGIMLYGASPVSSQSAAELSLKPVMHLHAPLIAINHLRAGECVGYGSEFICPDDMPVGIVAIGYGDGYPRHANQQTPVFIKGVRTNLIGRVSMDMLCIDLRGINEVKLGDPVELWGEHIALDDVAQNADSIAYELLCNMAACHE